MPEVKNGLEGVLGWMDENATLGKVYYTGLAGSAGTKSAGCGTKANDGSNAVYFGSAMVCCSGKWVHVAQGTKTIGSAGAATVCVNVEVGSDGVVDATVGGTAATVADAIVARAGTLAGHCPLGYVTVGTSGTVKSGSIVDDRTFLVPTSISYVRGLDYSWDQAPTAIYNRAAFAHYKGGRKKGKLTVKEDYVVSGSADIWPTTSTYWTVPTVAFELQINGIAGTVGEALLFQRCACDSKSMSQPDETEDSYEISALFGSVTAI